MFDIVEDPLKCPLDLGYFADLGQSELGLKVLLDNNIVCNTVCAPKISIRFKPVPEVDLFDVKPDLSSQIKLKQFLTPFQRFQVKSNIKIYILPSTFLCLTQKSFVLHQNMQKNIK